MPSGACVIRREGKRGAVFYVKFTDAAGVQVKERLGPESDGWTEKKARRELRHRLADVERKGWRRPAPLTFGEYAETWFAEGEARRRWKPGTVTQYRSVRRRLVEHFGPLPLAAIRPRHVAEYVAEASGELGASTVTRDVSLLHAIFVTAKREELVEGNPAERAERPKLPRRKWRILEPEEVARVARAFTDEQARTAFLHARPDRYPPLGAPEPPLAGRRPAGRDAPCPRVEVGGGGARDRASPHPRPGARRPLPADRLQAPGRARLLPPGAGHGLPRGSLPGGAESRAGGRRRGRRGSTSLPRPASCLAHERRRGRRAADRAHGAGWAPLDADDEHVPPPGSRRLPRRGRGARAADVRRYEGLGRRRGDAGDGRLSLTLGRRLRAPRRHRA
jgi:hypothetical protein